MELKRDCNVIYVVIVVNLLATRPLPLLVILKNPLSYGFNTLNEQGVQAIRDTAGILTSNFGNLVSNWVIGNEVNDVYEAICEAGDLKRQEGNSVKSCCTLPCRGISIKRISAAEGGYPGCAVG